MGILFSTQPIVLTSMLLGSQPDVPIPTCTNEDVNFLTFTRLEKSIFSKTPHVQWLVLTSNFSSIKPQENKDYEESIEKKKRTSLFSEFVSNTPLPLLGFPRLLGEGFGARGKRVPFLNPTHIATHEETRSSLLFSKEPVTSTERIEMKATKESTESKSEALREGLPPPPSSARYLSYSIGLDVESLLATGTFCPTRAKERCVLGNGAGLSLGTAYRTPNYSLGGVYEVTFHTSNNIYQRGVLQQLRGEWRLRPQFALFTDTINGFIGAGAGVATYGDNWSIATLGAAGHLTLGAEIDFNVKVTMVFNLTYRAMYFRGFDDASGQHRPTSLVHMLGIHIGVELNDPL